MRKPNRPLASRLFLVLSSFLLPLLSPTSSPAASGATGTGPAPAAAPAGAKTLGRTEDPVIVKGESLAAMLGRPVTGLRAYALRAGRFEPIPFQVDEFNKKGQVVLAQGKDPGEDEDKGMLDANDEVVVMAMDLGDRATAAMFPAGMRAAGEVEAADPAGAGRGWIYVLDFDAPPPESPVRYVKYDPVKDVAETPIFLVDFNERRSILLDDLRIKSAATEMGPNLIDRIQVRMTFKTRTFLTFHFDEEDIHSKVTAYKDGPVRAIRGTEYDLRLFFIKVTPTAHVDYLFYRNAIVGPSEVSIPFSPKYVLRGGSTAVSGLDFASQVYGWKFYSNKNPDPVTINGETKDGDGIEKDDVPWFVIFGQDKGTVTRVIYGPSLIKAKLGYVLQYRDDREKDGKPERELGETLLGFVVDLRRLPRGKHHLWFYQFFAVPYAMGDERKFNDIIDHPLTVKTFAVAPGSVPAAAEVVRPGGGS